MPTSPRIACLVVCATVVTALGRSHACDTPVYRYAMYRWTPTPYEVYFFHEDFFEERKYSEAETRLLRSLESAAEDSETPANVVSIPVNVFADPGLRSVPPDVRKLWNAQSDRSLPRYLVVSPQGALVHAGSLTDQNVPLLVDSPVRARLNSLLSEGKSGVFILLNGSDERANARAQETLNNLERDVAEGKIDLYKAPQGEVVGAPDAEPDAPKPAHSIGIVSLNRTDPKEKWLVDMLLSVESDLRDEEFEAQPMIFVAYGRGRALPPYIGKGISKDNLLEVLAFITGACSCTVKEQNPGIDLLTSYDWESAAEQLADKFGTEEGNESFNGPDEFFPELLVGPTQTQTSSVVGTKEPVDDGGPQPDPKKSNVLAPERAATTPEADVDPGKAEVGDDTKSRPESAPKPAVTGQKTGSSTEVAALEGSAVKGSREAAPAAGGSWLLTLGIGVGVGLFVLIGATLALYRKH